MPISIYRVTPEGEANENVAWLAENEWLLPPQIEELQSWILEHGGKLQCARYVADVGFCWRRNASGGGSAISPDVLKIMGQIGISLFLSEYGSFADDNE